MNTIQITKENNIAIVQLDRGVANAINLELLTELNNCFKDLANDAAVDGVILAGKGSFFSAGLDVIELYNYDEQKIKQLFEELFETMKTLVAFEKPLVAAVTGHSPAGGCVLAICADYRVMASGKYRIGLNEIPVGIIIPQFVYKTYAYCLGEGKASQFILEGKLLTSEEALAHNLVNEVVELEEVLDASKKQLKKYLSYGKATWSKSKRLMRADLLAQYANFNEDLKQELLEGWWSKDTRATLGALVAHLTKK